MNDQNPQDKIIQHGRPKRGGGSWITARKAVQYSALIFFIGLILMTVEGTWTATTLDTILRLDPLLMLGHAIASRTFLVTSLFGLILVVLALLFGRAWCGWLCPLGTILDLVPLGSKRRKRSDPPQGWRKVKYDLVLVILVGALLGNLTLLFLDPLTILVRTLTVSFIPALDRIESMIEATLYRVPFLQGPVGIFGSWIRPAILPQQPMFYQEALLSAGLFLGLILLNYFAARFWCRYLCPLGGFLGLISKIAVLQRRVGEECKGCTLCTNICPTGTIDPAKSFQSDPAECTLCLDCVDICPRGLNSFTLGLPKPIRNEYDPSGSDVLAAVGVAVMGVALLKSTKTAKIDPEYLVRPPGARENNPDPVVLTKCIRCGNCMRTCPTGGLQPAMSETGIGGLGTPVLVSRLGYCDYSCNACGQVCPVQAIPPLSLEQKQLQVIGKAFIDQNRCIAWSDHLPCLVCQEMCPLPEKAIQMETTVLWSPEGNKEIKLPHVLRDICIGCGICEYRCPVGGAAAIRVHGPQAANVIYMSSG